MNLGKKFKKTSFIHSIYKRIIDMKISLKLTLAYLAGASVCMLILSMSFYINTRNYIENHTKELLSQTLKQAKDNIDYKVDLYNMLADTIYLNTNLQELLFSEYSNPSDKLDALNWVLAYIRPLKSSYKDLIKVSLVVSNPTLPPYGDEILQENNVSHESWYRQTMESGQKIMWMHDADANIAERLVISRKLEHLTYESVLGAIRIELNEVSFFKTINENGKEGKGWFDVVDAENNIVYSGLGDSDSKFKSSIFSEYDRLLFDRHENFATISANNQKYMTMQNKIDYTGWKILYTVPLSSYTDAIRKLQFAAVGFLLLSALLFIAISWFLAYSFTRRIRMLSHSMEKIQTGQFDVYIDSSGSDEIGHLISGFNIMAHKLKELIEEVYAIKIKEKESEMQALQAQINPHFLYNTLASISMLGMRIGGEDITRMSNSLAKFYKVSLSNGKNIINVKDEIEHVKAYMDIQNMRFKNKVSIVYEIDEDVLNVRSLKLMLQPFIENSIGHGLWKDKKSITIRIVVLRDGEQIRWRIIDDGVGISQQRLNAIINSNESRGYGIVNVDQRIKLFFGDEYGVNIFSRAGIGTVVDINTPFNASEQNR